MDILLAHQVFCGIRMHLFGIFFSGFIGSMISGLNKATLL